MLWVDYLILAILLLSIVVGLWRGFLREVMAIAVWLAALWLAYRGVGEGALMLEGWIEVPSVRIIVAFASIFIVVLVIGGLLSWLLGRVIATTGLGGTDRLIGMIFGLARGVVLVAVAVLLARFTPFPQDPWWRQSRLLPYFERVAETAETWLPQSIRQYLPAEEAAGDTLISES
ncbi:MAG: CvpA family protein [Wenzhouxiangellaceae bacterium]